MPVSEKIHAFPASNGAELLTATILARSDDLWTLDSGGTVIAALRAASCLLEPDEGDLVLVARSGSDHFIISVLKQTANAANRLSLHGDTEIGAEGGRLTLASSHAVEVVASEHRITSARLDVVTDELHATGRSLNSRIGVVQHSGDRVESMVGQIMQRCKNLIRWVDGTETTTAGNSIQSVRRMLNIRADNAVITARKDIKVNGERIHMG